MQPGWAGLFQRADPLGVGVAIPCDDPDYCPPINNMVAMTTSRSYFTPDLTAAAFYASNCSSQKNKFPANIYSWNMFTVLQFTKTVLVIGTTNQAEALYYMHIFRLTYGQLPMPVYAQYCPVTQTWAEPEGLVLGEKLFSMRAGELSILSDPGGGGGGHSRAEVPPGGAPSEVPPCGASPAHTCGDGTDAPACTHPHDHDEHDVEVMYQRGKRDRVPCENNFQLEVQGGSALRGDERIWRPRKKQRRQQQRALVPPMDMGDITAGRAGPPCYDEPGGGGAPPLLGPYVSHRKQHVQVVIGQAPCLAEVTIGRFSIRNIVAVGRVCEDGLRLDPMYLAWNGEKIYHPRSFPGLKLFVPVEPGSTRKIAANIFTTGHCLLMGQATPDEVAHVFWLIKQHALPHADGTVPMSSTARNADRVRRHDEFTAGDIHLHDQDAAAVERAVNLISASVESGILRDVELDDALIVDD